MLCIQNNFDVNQPIKIELQHNNNNGLIFLEYIKKSSAFFEIGNDLITKFVTSVRIT